MNIAEQFRDAEKRGSQEWGSFALFALVEREDHPGLWDVVVSAPWLTTDRAGIEEIVTLLRAGQDVIDWLKVARIVPLAPSEEFVQSMARIYDMEHGLKEIAGITLNGIRVSHAYVITANPQAAGVKEYQIAA